MAIKEKRSGQMSRGEFIKLSSVTLCGVFTALACKLPFLVTQDQMDKLADSAVKTAVANIPTGTSQSTAQDIANTPTPEATQTSAPTTAADTSTSEATQASAPTAMNTPEPTMANLNQEETIGNLPRFTIFGVPNQINQENLLKWTERPTEPGDVAHENTIGFGTQAFLAEPGVLTTDEYDKKNPTTWYSKDADVQKTFEQKGPSYWGAPEGGFAMFTAAAMELNFEGLEGKINVQLDAEENHGWIVIVRGLSRDYQTPMDLNMQIEITDYNPGYIMGTRLPPGQWVSEDYLKQNVDAAHIKNCGMDGCKRVSALFIDPQGAYTVITQNGLNASWQLAASNIK